MPARESRLLRPRRESVVVNVVFVTTDGDRINSQAEPGTPLLDLAQSVGLPLEGTCEGQMACSTCHVVVDGAWFGKLAKPTEDEEDMLDLAFDLQETSRLGCQLIMTDALDGLVVRLPAGTRNAGG